MQHRGLKVNLFKDNTKYTKIYLQGILKCISAFYLHLQYKRFLTINHRIKQFCIYHLTEKIALLQQDRIYSQEKHRIKE